MRYDVLEAFQVAVEAKLELDTHLKCISEVQLVANMDTFEELGEVASTGDAFYCLARCRQWRGKRC